MRARTLADAGDLFRHVSAEKGELYRAILDVFARAKRQYRQQLRPDEVHAEARWTGAPPGLDDVNAALVQLREWGNPQPLTFEGFGHGARGVRMSTAAYGF